MQRKRKVVKRRRWPHSHSVSLIDFKKKIKRGKLFDWFVFIWKEGGVERGKEISKDFIKFIYIFNVHKEDLLSKVYVIFCVYLENSFVMLWLAYSLSIMKIRRRISWRKRLLFNVCLLYHPPPPPLPFSHLNEI